jgi:putative cardiolipin synthase
MPPKQYSQSFLPLHFQPTHNTCYFLENGPQSLQERLVLINNATHSIDFQTYIMGDDLSGRALWHALLQAAKRGVRVRVLLDDISLEGSLQERMQLIQHPNLELKIYNPSLNRGNSKLGKYLLYGHNIRDVSYRMHSKAFVVDNQYAIVGGRNAADEYYLFSKQYNFIDYEIKASENFARNVAASFDLFWQQPRSVAFKTLVIGQKIPPKHANYEKELAIAYKKTSAILDALSFSRATPHECDIQWFTDMPKTFAANDHPPTQVGNQIIKLIQQAKKDVFIISAYLVPNPPLEEALIAASQRGVNVTVLTNSPSSIDVEVVIVFTNKIAPKLINAGINLYEINSAFPVKDHLPDYAKQAKTGLHAKVMTIDGNQLWIGSANFDYRSFEINTEYGALINSATLYPIVDDRFRAMLKNGNAFHLVLNKSTKKLQYELGDKLRFQHQSLFTKVVDVILSWLPIKREL